MKGTIMKKKRNRIAVIIVVAIASVSFMLSSVSPEAQTVEKDSRPNILLITTDQQHARLMSCAGDPYVNTPNLDKLAASGMRFENAYSANPVCVPSRYSMISGYMPHVFDGLETNRQMTINVKPVIADYINTPTMGTIFKEAGYETLYGGKLHVEGSRSLTKEMESTFNFTNLTEDSRLILAEKAVEAFQQKRGKPFLMWVSFINPHDICSFPLDKNEERYQRQQDGLKKLHERYPGIPLPPLPENFEISGDEIDWVRAHQKGEVGNSGLNQTFGAHAKNWDIETWREYRWAYRRHMETVDMEIGIVLQGLKDAGLDENTVIILTSDHGDHDGAHQLTMKRSFYEEVSNIPLIVSWKRHCTPGSVDSSTLVNNGLDLIPTLCDIAGIKIPKGLSGVSFRPALEGHRIDRDYIVGQNNTGRMLRTPRYKYNVYYIDGQSGEQLFDMKKDRKEMNNLAKKTEYYEILKYCRKELREWVIANNDSRGEKYLVD